MGDEPAAKKAKTNGAGAGRLDTVFQKVKDTNRAAFIAYLTAGFPCPEETVGLMMALQRGGTDIIELGVPFTDPQADGGTIQRASMVALTFKVNITKCLAMVKEARSKGLTVPVVLMGYYNPFLAYGLDALMEDTASNGADGFIIVDLPPEEGVAFAKKSSAYGLSYVPLVSPTTTDDRISILTQTGSSFMYCVSLTGVTGARTELPKELPDFVKRVRASSNKPLAVGFGISQPSQVKAVAAFADAVVVGSAIINTIEASAKSDAVTRQTKLESFASVMTKAIEPRTVAPTYDAKESAAVPAAPKSEAYFGEFGGAYIPETLVEAHRELEEAYAATLQDPTFQEEIDWYRREFIGGPTPLYLAKRLTEEMGGAKIWFKREELAHTGAHKINNAVGQALLAKRLGKKRIIAETGAGQHGVASACVCALLNLPLTVYMGAADCERQKLNVFRMKTLGATVVPVESGSRTLKDAINEAMRDWVTNVRDTHYLIGSAIGPHPFPTIVRDFQSVIGREARAQMLEKAGKLPDYVIACVGGGSNAIGMFHAFIKDPTVKIVGVEAGGEGEGGRTSATLTMGKPGVLHGTRTYLLQDEDGQIPETHSISAGLDYPGVGPEHAFLKDSGRADYVAVTDVQAMEAFSMLCKKEGLIPALEPSHAVYHALQLAKSLPKDKDVLVNLCGRGDKDMHTVAKYYNVDVN